MADESGLSRNRRYIVWDTEKASLNKLQTNKRVALYYFNSVYSYSFLTTNSINLSYEQCIIQLQNHTCDCSHSNFKLVLNNECWRVRESFGWPIAAIKYEMKRPLLIVVNDVLATSIRTYIAVAVLFITELRKATNMTDPLCSLNRNTRHILKHT
jgi:hypothetical protein